jgi:hypothetical protein
MPLILDNNIINTINGPICVYFLQQINEDANLNNNFFIFFGEKHDLEGYTPCFDDTDCFEIQTDFIKMLNTFASTTRTDFYLEKFLGFIPKNTIMTPQQMQKYSAEASKFQNVYSKLRSDTELKNMSPEERKQKIAEYNKEITNNMYKLLPTERSNMAEMGSLYKSCFNLPLKKELCPYKNINWQYEDARQSNLYLNGNGKSSIESITNDIQNFFNYFFDNYLDNDNTDKQEVSKDALIEFEISAQEGEVNTIEMLSNVKLMVTDLNAYIKKLIAQPIYQKQLKKMNEYTKSILTEDSFVKLANTYAELFKPEDISNLNTVVDLFISYYNLCPEGNNCLPENSEKLEELIAKFNSLSFKKKQLEQMVYIPMGIGNCAMDIYFILRTYKQDRDIPNTKLTLNYAGSLHSEKLAFYFTDIVKTHTSLYSADEITDSRRVQITQDINLNNIMGHTPITIGGKKTRKYKRVNNSKKSKKAKKNNKSKKSRK